MDNGNNLLGLTKESLSSPLGRSEVVAQLYRTIKARFRTDVFAACTMAEDTEKAFDELYQQLTAVQAERDELKQKYIESSDKKLQEMDQDNLYRFMAKERDWLEAELSQAKAERDELKSFVALCAGPSLPLQEEVIRLTQHLWAAQARETQLREALENLLEENEDYIKINHLSAMGNVNLVKARAALKEAL